MHKPFFLSVCTVGHLCCHFLCSLLAVVHSWNISVSICSPVGMRGLPVFKSFAVFLNSFWHCHWLFALLHVLAVAFQLVPYLCSVDLLWCSFVFVLTVFCFVVCFP